MFRMRAICCKTSCPNRVSCGGPACIMAVGGYGHLEHLHVEHLGTEADMVDRQKKHNGVFGGQVKNTGPVAERRSVERVRYDRRVVLASMMDWGIRERLFPSSPARNKNVLQVPAPGP